jgi:trehalose/maltose hydrolase-like predicted phosphorylase
MCARTGHLDLAHDYLHEAALVDLRDLHGNARDGLHMASMAGAWSALVDGFGGMAIEGSTLSIDPQLPDGMTRLAFRFHWHGMRVLVEVTGTEVRVALRDGADAVVELLVGGERVRLSVDEPVVRPWRRRPPLLPRPPQPPGREPDVRE